MSSATPASASGSATSISKEVQLNTKAGMKYVRLGNSGLRVSKIILGCMTYGTPSWREWVLDKDQSRPFIKAALDAGISTFDTADMYSLGESERVLGSLLKEFGTRREDVVICSKLFFPMTDGPNNRGLSRKHVFDAIDASLARLQMDYIDVWQIHRWDNNTSPEEVMEALHDVVKSGKVRYIGASSMYCYQFQYLQNIAEKRGWTKFISMQSHYNLVYREEEREMNPYCAMTGVGIVPWSPLARGFLAGNRAKSKQEEKASGVTVRAKTDTFGHDMYYQETDFEIQARCAELAQKKGVTCAQMALAWLLSQTVVSAPIVGASKLYQLEEAIAATKIELSKEDKKFLEEKYTPHQVLGNLS